MARNRGKNRAASVVVQVAPQQAKQQTQTQQANQPARRRRGRRNKAARRGRTAGMGQNGAAACVRALARSMVEPWNYSSCIPDATRYLQPFTLKQTGSIATGSTGTVMGVLAGLQPDAFVYEDKAGTTGTTAISGSWSNCTAIGTLANLYSQYRVVSAGIRVWFTGASLTDQGTIVVGQVSSQSPASGFNATTLSNLTAASAVFKVSALRDGASITWRPEDNHGQADLYDVDSTAQAVSSILDHSWLYCYAFGAATNTAASMQYEVTVNMEGQLGNQTFMPGGMTPEAPTAVGGWYETVGNFLKNIPAYAKPATDIASSAFQAYTMVNGGSNGMRRMLRSQNRIEL